MCCDLSATPRLSTKIFTLAYCQLKFARLEKTSKSDDDSIDIDNRTRVTGQIGFAAIASSKTITLYFKKN